MTQFKIYLDLDGCFSDFNSKVQEVTGSLVWTPDHWSIIDKVPNFFAKLDILPHSKPAFNAIMSFGLKTEILTAMPKPTNQFVTTAADKTKWVRRHLHPTIPVNCSDGWDKKIDWVAPNHILVDDMQRNIDHWEQHGGIGVHHGGNWDKTILTLKNVLRSK
jgi:5'(3')-deoxyribonucleotidase